MDVVGLLTRECVDHLCTQPKGSSCGSGDGEAGNGGGGGGAALPPDATGGSSPRPTEQINDNYGNPAILGSTSGPSSETSDTDEQQKQLQQETEKMRQQMENWAAINP